jgi:hypothetical protein
MTEQVTLPEIPEIRWSQATLVFKTANSTYRLEIARWSNRFTCVKGAFDWESDTPIWEEGVEDLSPYRLAWQYATGNDMDTANLLAQSFVGKPLVVRFQDNEMNQLTTTEVVECFWVLR